MIFSLGFTSCYKDGDKLEPYTSGHFIDGYFDYDSISVKNTESGNIAVYPSNLRYICGWFAGYLNYYSEMPVTEHYKKDNQTAGFYNMPFYDSLSLKNGDVGYTVPKYIWKRENEMSPYILADGAANQYLICDIISINIKSNNAFDDSHSAGSSLNDIVKLMSLTSHQFINSHYTDVYNWTYEKWNATTAIEKYFFQHPYDNIAEHFDNFRLYFEYLVETNYSDVRGMFAQQFYYPAIPPIFYLHFTQVPTLSQTHELTITVTLNDGRVFEKQITKNTQFLF
jgi:hypothetical protein